MIDLTGQAALVTGGSRGIGRATALLLARSGADIALTYHTRGQDAEVTVGEVEALGRRAFAFGGDLADPAVVERTMSEVLRHLGIAEQRAGRAAREPGLALAALPHAAGEFDDLARRDAEGQLGRLDIFVANAGIWPAEEVRLASITTERWRRTVEANLDSVFLSTRAALRLMGAGGRVVIVSSTAGQRGEADRFIVFSRRLTKGREQQQSDPQTRPGQLSGGLRSRHYRPTARRRQRHAIDNCLPFRPLDRRKWPRPSRSAFGCDL